MSTYGPEFHIVDVKDQCDYVEEKQQPVKLYNNYRVGPAEFITYTKYAVPIKIMS